MTRDALTNVLRITQVTIANLNVGVPSESASTKNTPKNNMVGKLHAHWIKRLDNVPREKLLLSYNFDN